MAEAPPPSPTSCPAADPTRTVCYTKVMSYLTAWLAGAAAAAAAARTDEVAMMKLDLMKCLDRQRLALGPPALTCYTYERPAATYATTVQY